jgi:hypothetical protein
MSSKIFSLLFNCEIYGDINKLNKLDAREFGIGFLHDAIRDTSLSLQAVVDQE